MVCTNISIRRQFIFIHQHMSFIKLQESKVPKKLVEKTLKKNAF